MSRDLKYIFFDTEMSGCDQLVSLGYVVTDAAGEVIEEDYYVIKPHKKIKKSTIAIHGITTEQAKKEGIPLKKGLAKFLNAAKECAVHVGYAPQNDILALALGWKFVKQEIPYDRGEWIVVDVARLSVPYMLERGKITDGQTPRLCGLYAELFDGETYEAHNALSDAKATAKCFWKLVNEGHFHFQSIIPHSKIHHLCVPKPPKPKPAATVTELQAPAEESAAPDTDGASAAPDAPAQEPAAEAAPKRKRHRGGSRRRKKRSSAASLPESAPAAPQAVDA